ncbi:MAG: hypothetical protein M3450_11205 [Actinomycetota bacterium]|nr:hypothetical protein [Actinomycetota bacterium]
MPVPPLDDRALEALLSGAPSAQSGFDWLLPFVEELGEASRGSAPPMTPALALLVAEGFSIDKVDLPAPHAAGRPKWARKLVLTGLATKFGSLGLVAKAAMGLTLVAASTTAAGAAGVLPAPAQHVVATVVDVATPFTFPDETKDKANFGATVGADATGASDGVPGVDGKAVSDAARNKTKPDGPSGVPGGNGVGANTGAKGLDRANETPAAGHAPTSVPGGGAAVVPGSPAANGLGTANTTPAAGKVPTSVPPVTPAAPASAGAPGSNGLDTAGTTPAAGRVPARP